MKLLHVHLSGWTATFRLPLLYSGTGLTSPLPPYSTLIGLIGSLAGREIQPDETRIGFIFCSEGYAVDLETTFRLKIDKSSKRLKTHKERGIAKRQFHIRPSLDLYLDNLSLQSVFEYPANPPCLGRSQDVAWIDVVEIVEAEPVEEGIIQGTLVPFPEPDASGLILLLPDYFDNADLGYTRSIGHLGKYQAVKYDAPAKISRPGLYHVERLQPGHAVYLHTICKGANAKCQTHTNNYGLKTMARLS